MTDVERTTSEDVFVVEVLPDSLLRDALDRRRPALGANGETQLSRGAARPLTGAEREAAQNDPGVSPRVYAPASLRVAKRPLPADERFFLLCPASRPRAHERPHTIALRGSATAAVRVSSELIQSPA